MAGVNAFVTFWIRLLEVLFVVGWAGTIVVLLLTGIEDLETILRREPHESGVEAASHAETDLR